MTVKEATTDEELLRCYPVMAELRTDLDETGFLERVARQQATDRYRLVYVEEGGEVVAVAGFRVQEMLSRGRFLYVDDLVTAAHARSNGYGRELLDWLKEEGRRHACRQLDLDSGVQRGDAHRFYFREGMTIPSYHFAVELGE